jgi:hypothetical protein
MSACKASAVIKMDDQAPYFGANEAFSAVFIK